ncbi:MAG: CsbD family protein [Tepidiformaceae bacterium]
MDKDKLEGKGREAMGATKEKVGDVTGNKDLEAEGKTEKYQGKAQGAWGDAKDKAGDAADDVKDAFKKN